VVTTWRTITLENAKYAVKIYNEGLYGCLKNPDLDGRAREMFTNGLGSTMEQIAQQVEFIGRSDSNKVDRQAQAGRSVNAGAKIDRITPRKRGDAAEGN
jgi:hypothetical protein